VNTRLVVFASCLSAFLIAFSTPTVALGQTPPPPAPPSPGSSEPRPVLVSRPSYEPVQEALRASRIERVRVGLVVAYDAKGVPIDLSLDPPSGNAEVDLAIIEWGRKARLKPGKAGSGRILFELMNDEYISPAPIDGDTAKIPAERFALRPPTQPVAQALSDAGLPKTLFEFIVFYSAEGAVIDVTLTRASGQTEVDRAASQWARGLRFKPGAAGAGLVSVEIAPMPVAAAATP